MTIHIPTMDDVHRAQIALAEHLSAAPLIRSYRLEQALGLSATRRVWIKDYGWTPSGSFKCMGALNWMANNSAKIGDRPVVAHSSGNFASGLAYAGSRFNKRVTIVMPESAPQVKFDLTRSFGAEIQTYDITTDHETQARSKLTAAIVENQNGVQASPYDDPYVISGNGVGGVEIGDVLRQQGRGVSHFFCQVSGGGLLAGHALAIADCFPEAQIVGVEPSGANDFQQSLAADERVRLEKPTSICDGLLSYDVGEHNWPILRRDVSQVAVVEDVSTCRAMKWLYDNHGLKTEPSGAITTAAILHGDLDLSGDGDIVIVLSGRNVDNDAFQEWLVTDGV
ncbi:MAG: pyridoxal-phosphate dependent enzyme [Planctomycetaceae bacterium]|nr:pyridoxal-phosphate dependent enzyme [Planctomycetaceae bacterium]MBT4011932.1 pyridoxal-phosphate dependent enzyme [Planctomycetaceae bacterium]MBT4725989.1 pyridoxal-phosphate dependent enzyme [Planctomycetaceae bacterium]MBT5122986.1 pyridoxal-phosphate dependent enzyme [Planctomycetaceae bacterium]MBT5597633.1 pyridoxal-phosphate dependent enzyme [Planctomycetaceae bacterium]